MDVLNNIKHVVFDFGGVLVDLYRERCVEAFCRMGFPQAGQMIGLYGPSDTFMKLESGEISGQELVEYIRRESGNDSITYNDVRDAYVAFLGEIPVKKLAAIRALRKVGIKTWGLSNINEFVMPYTREKLFTAEGFCMEDYFDHTYLSYEVGLLKPDPAIFHAMIAHGGMQPEETLFIDDSEKNIATARELGFQVYLAAPQEDFTPLLYEIIRAKEEHKEECDMQ